MSRTAKGTLLIDLEEFVWKKSISSVKIKSLYSIKGFKVCIASGDIAAENEVLIDFIPLENAKNPIKIENLPLGKNRVISVIPFDSFMNEVDFLTLRAVYDIVSETNTFVVNKKTTAWGNLIFRLIKSNSLKNINSPDKETESDLQILRGLVTDSIHPLLFDVSGLFGSYTAYSFGAKEDYLLKTGSYTFEWLLCKDFTVIVNDPISEAKTFTEEGKVTLPEIAPGIWILSIFDKEGNLLDKAKITIKSGKDSKTGHFSHDGIALLFPENAEISCKDKSQLLCKKKNVLYSNLSYNIYDFTNKNELSFSVNFSTGKAKEYSIKGKGVFLLDEEGNLTALTPQSKRVDLEDFPLTALNYATCFYDKEKSREVLMLFNPEYWNYTNEIQDVSADFNGSINDFSEFDGGNYPFIKDSKSGIWYAVIDYDNLRQTNQSGQPTFRLNVNDKDIEIGKMMCAKKSESGVNLEGYIYVKYNSLTPMDYKFPLIIFNRQNPEYIRKRFEAEKNYKVPADFNFSKIEDIKILTNFRLCPASKNLFRSYHPIYSDKLFFESDPYRMTYLAYLGEKFQIKSDINISDDTELKTAPVDLFEISSGKIKKNVTDYLPAYYKENVKNILFLKKEAPEFGYIQCYTSSDSEAFAKAIGKIVRFINHNPGPYQIHCAIGTDRTGIVCAILEGLCGASWKEICNDYCASFYMGILEYRGEGCVKYAVEQCAEIKDVYLESNLQEKLITNISKKGNVSREEILTMVSRLKGE